MDLIKRHYEKVILLGLFGLFVGLMFLVQSVISSTESVTEADLRLVKRKPDFENEDPKLAKFDTNQVRESTSLKWKFPEAKTLLSDFVTPFPMASCPHCREAKIKEAKERDPNYVLNDDQLFTMLVPLASFSTENDRERKCPQCGEVLQWVKEISADEIEVQREREADRDGDGVMDEDESKYGMDPANPHDARYDMDGDGFSNIFEIKNGYAPNDAESHPPYWWRLHIKKIDLIELSVRFMALNDNQSTDKHNWILQFNHPDLYGRNRIASSFLRIGDTLLVEGRRYRIADVERRLVPVKKSENMTTAEKNLENDKLNKGFVDKSRVHLVEVISNGNTPDKLTMEVNQPAYSSDKRPVLIDSGDIRDSRKDHILKINDMVRLELFQNDRDNSGERRRRPRFVAAYRLKLVDDEKGEIVLEEVIRKSKKVAAGEKEKPEDIRISIKEPKVPEKMFPIKKVDVGASQEEQPDEGGIKTRRRRR